MSGFQYKKNIEESEEDKNMISEIFLPKDNWIPDDHVTKCTLCEKAFDMMNRRHHCRMCGNIFDSK